MSVIFEGIEMPKACCFVDGEHSSFAHFEYCKFYNICKQRETIKTGFKPNDCPVKPMNQEMITKNDLGVDKFDKAINQSDLEEWIMETFPDWCVGDVRLIMNHMDEMPSVTPQEPQTFRWCTDCKEYDQEKHCCHRWSKVIRDTVEEMKQEPKTGHWKLVQRGKNIDVCCSNCKAVRIKGYAYNYTIDQLSKEDVKECFECADMRYCPNCGADMREVDK